MHGSPCQDFSTMGKEKGGDEDSGTRSSLMFETIRIVKKLKPKYVIWENVSNVLQTKHKHNFVKYLKYMENLEYKNFYQVLNTKDYGIPQSRPRLFVVSILGGKNYYFPQKKKLKVKLADLLENNVPEKYFLKDKTLEYFVRHEVEMRENKKGFRFGINNGQHNTNTITTKCGQRMDDTYIADDTTIKNIRNRQHYLQYSQKGYFEQHCRVYFDEIGTLKTRCNVQIHHLGKVRRLTPLECFRLQGFSDECYKKAKSVVSDYQLYKQIGNSITVDVIYYILHSLLVKPDIPECEQLSIL